MSLHDDIAPPYVAPYMQKTDAGFEAREKLEVTFWTVVGFLLVMAVIVPVGIGVGTRLWTWALS